MFTGFVNRSAWGLFQLNLQLRMTRHKNYASEYPSHVNVLVFWISNCYNVYGLTDTSVFSLIVIAASFQLYLSNSEWVMDHLKYSLKIGSK